MTKIIKVDITVKNDSPTGAVFFLFFNTPHCQSWTEQLYCPFTNRGKGNMFTRPSENDAVTSEKVAL